MKTGRVLRMGRVGALASAVAVLGVLALGGCKSETTPAGTSGGATSSAAAGAAKPGAIVAANKICPIMLEHPVRKNLEERLTRQYKGKLIGFCCSDCPDAWDALSDEEKDKALVDAAKAEAGEK